MITVTIEYDSDAESPNEWGGWRLYSFSNRHRSHKDREEFFPDGKPTIGLRSKLRHNLAFVLDYYEHGNCTWSRSGHGPQCQWDNSRGAGILVFEGQPRDIKPEKRIESADGFLEIYTDWCNGTCYWINVKTDDGDLDENTDTIGYDDLDDIINDMISGRGVDEEVVIEGQCADMLNGKKIKGGVPAEVWEAELASREIGAGI